MRLPLLTKSSSKQSLLFEIQLLCQPVQEVLHLLWDPLLPSLFNEIPKIVAARTIIIATNEPVFLSIFICMVPPYTPKPYF
jgi:hypothetical protein